MKEYRMHIISRNKLQDNLIDLMQILVFKKGWQILRIYDDDDGNMYYILERIIPEA